MKNLIIGLFIMLTLHTYANTDTLYANISAVQAHDTILAYTYNPFFVILDVRTASEYATHIEGAVNIDFYNPNFSLIIDSLNKNKIYLIHCASGGRSGQVYTMMQAKHFKTVYNMTGGISAWNSAAFPTTTVVYPKLDFLNDSLLIFNTTIGNTDSILVTITNSRNSVLHVSSNTSLNGTEFATSFNNISLFGARDYSFYFYYHPADLINDSIVVSVESDGGNKYFYIYGFTNQTSIEPTSLNNQLYLNAYKFGNNLFVSADKTIYKVTISDINGKILYDKKTNNTQIVIELNNITSGVYIVSAVIDEKTAITKKLFLWFYYLINNQ